MNYEVIKDATAMLIHADIAAKLNFAAHQSAFSVLRSLGIENPDAEQQLEELVLTLRSTPAFKGNSGDCHYRTARGLDFSAAILSTGAG